MNPGNSGASKTRALVCELLAIRLLREYSTRELIDALSYDFYPSQGLVPENSGNVTPGPNWESQKPRSQPRAARVSTLEVAIRAQAKRSDIYPYSTATKNLALKTSLAFIRSRHCITIIILDRNGKADIVIDS